MQNTTKNERHRQFQITICYCEINSLFGPIRCNRYVLLTILSNDISKINFKILKYLRQQPRKTYLYTKEGLRPKTVLFSPTA